MIGDVHMKNKLKQLLIATAFGVGILGASYGLMPADAVEAGCHGSYANGSGDIVPCGN